MGSSSSSAERRRDRREEIDRLESERRELATGIAILLYVLRTQRVPRKRPGAVGPRRELAARRLVPLGDDWLGDLHRTSVDLPLLAWRAVRSAGRRACILDDDDDALLRSAMLQISFLFFSFFEERIIT